MFFELASISISCLIFPQRIGNIFEWKNSKKTPRPDSFWIVSPLLTDHTPGTLGVRFYPALMFVWSLCSLVYSHVYMRQPRAVPFNVHWVWQTVMTLIYVVRIPHYTNEEKEPSRRCITTHNENAISKPVGACSLRLLFAWQYHSASIPPPPPHFFPKGF